jgi:hypothetical protein
MAEQVYRYKAFISYRHLEQDRKWAKWLVERLETFRTPRSLVQTGVPSRIGRLFRDDDEVPASSDLSNQIEDALKASQYLIVVCSRATPASKWVKKEIDFFRALGRGDRILALLIEGEPGEAFPENLLRVPHERIASDGSRITEWADSEPIAADVRDRPGESRKELERRAFLRIAAGLLGCSFDDLFQRERQRQRRRQRLLGSAAALLASAAATGVYLWWDYYVPRVAYYAEFGTHWGAPFGVGELDREAVAHRGASYEVTSQYHHVILMRRVGGLGSLRPLNGDGFDDESLYQGIAVWRVYYQNDQVKTVELGNGEGKLVRKLDYDFAPDRSSAIELYRSAKGNIGAIQAGMFNIVTFAQPRGVQNISQVAGHELLFTPDGLIKLRNFQTAFGQPADAGNGSFGRSYSYYANGLVRSFRDLDEDGATHLDEAGIAGVFRGYDPAGNLVFLEWRDSRGRPTLNSHGYARWRGHRDGYGNVVLVSFSGPDGKAATNNILQASQFTSRIDSHGNDVQEEYFDTHGHRAVHPAGFSELRWQYDSLGRVIVEECYGPDLRPVLNRSGYFRMIRKYDAAGAPIGEHFYGVNGKPIIPANIGWAALERHYDHSGNLTSQHYFGPDGKPMLNALGIASVTRARLPRGNADVESYFGVRGEPVDRADYGVARILRHYDQYGNVVDETYFGVGGRKTVRKDLGVAEISAVYDDRGDITDQRFLDENGRPIADRQLGIARIQRSYSKDGSEHSEHYFDTADRPAARRDLQVAAIAAHFDRHGNEVEEDYYAADGNRQVRADYGAAIVKRRYDTKGNETEESYFGIADKPVVRRDRGFARISFHYDPRGNRIEEAYFTTDDRPANNLLGFSRLRRRYDVLGHKLEEAYFGATGQPAVRTDSAAARLVWHYDATGIKRELSIYDTTNRLQSVIRLDAAGHAIPKER